MKNFAVLSLVFLFVLSSEAQIKKTYERVKQAVTGSAHLSQLHYFPSQWEADLTVGYRLQNLDIMLKTPSTTVSDTSQNISNIETTLKIGLMDSLFAKVEWQYLIEMKIDDNQDGSSTKYTGPEEPLFSLVYRAVDVSSFKLDAQVGYQPSLGDAKDADSSHDGNGLAGGQAFIVGAKAVAVVTESSQIAANVILKNNGDATSVDQTTNDEVVAEAHNQLNVELSTMTALTSQLYFGLQLDLINIDSYDRTGATTSEVGATKGQVLNLIGKYELNPDHLITAEAGYILDYNGEVLNLDLTAEGHSIAVNYTIRF